MGKKYAPVFANIFMHYWEQKALSSTITLLCFGNATSMTFSTSGDTPRINYTLLFNTSIPTTPTLKLVLLTIYIPLIFWIATSLKITPNF